VVDDPAGFSFCDKEGGRALRSRLSHYPQYCLRVFRANPHFGLPWIFLKAISFTAAAIRT
jgi:hypothetical protein